MLYSGWPEIDLAVMMKNHLEGQKLGMIHMVLPAMLKKVKKTSILMRKRNNLYPEGQAEELARRL